MTEGMGYDGHDSHTSKVGTCCTNSWRSTASCRVGDERGTRSEDSGADSGWQPLTGNSVVSATVDQTP